ncbi:MAG: hypothetical protein ACI95S_002213 [Dinoroseobacter sp.]
MIKVILKLYAFVCLAPLSDKLTPCADLRSAVQQCTGDRRGFTMRARIYQPARTAMQSGSAKTKNWVLEYAPSSARSVDPLMGWTSSDDMNSQVKLSFDSKEAALDYAKAKGLDAVVTEPKTRKPVIRAGGYGENFATARRGAWTH